MLPDIFHGEAWPETSDWSTFGAWREKFPIDVQVTQLERLITDAHLIYKPKSLGAVGFCWGGRHCVKLAATDKVYAAAVAHGSFIEQEEVEAVKQPIFFLFADNVSLSLAERNGCKINVATAQA